jgi:hypothetical protein
MNSLATHIARDLLDFVDAYYFPEGLEALVRHIQESIDDFKKETDD